MLKAFVLLFFVLTGALGHQAGKYEKIKLLSVVRTKLHARCTNPLWICVCAMVCRDQ